MRTATFVVLIAISRLAEAATLTVTLKDRSTAKTCGGAVTVSAAAETGESKVASSGGASVDIELTGGNAWKVRAQRAGCWSTTADWLATSADRDLVLELFSAAMLDGTFAVEGRDKPQRLHASAFRVQPARRSAVSSAEPETLECELKFPRWQCGVPAELPLDIRLDADGFGSAYLWDVALKAGERRTVPAQKLIYGASIAGWVHGADDTPLQGAVITLLPLQADHENASRTATVMHHQTSTGKRGFFQLTGLTPGDYRLVSRTRDFPPAVLPIVTIRPATSMTWPVPLRHEHSVGLEVAVEPEQPSDGASWRVTLTDSLSLTPGTPRAAIALRRNEAGFWEASGLRAGHYELHVRDSAGAIVAKRNIDLSNGSPGLLTLSIEALAVRGSVTIGGEPLAGAFLRFTASEGKAVQVTSDEEGQFRATFPSPGAWTPLVYPHGRQSSPSVRAKAIEIRAGMTDDVEVQLPGGRIRGSVVTQTGAPAKGAVHAVRDNRLVTQQVTAADGKFDFLGLAHGEYELTAEGFEGMTARPIKVGVGRDDTNDVKLALEPYRTLRGTVRTPSGAPASGAVVRVSTDGGVAWSDLIARVRGDFEYAVPAGLDYIQLVVVASGYPAAMARVTLRNGQTPVAIDLQPHGGVLSVDPPRAFVYRGDVVASLHAFYPPLTLGLGPVVQLEPGSYTVCPELRRDNQCRSLQIAPGATTTVSFESR